MATFIQGSLIGVIVVDFLIFALMIAAVVWLLSHDFTVRSSTGSISFTLQSLNSREAIKKADTTSKIIGSITLFVVILQLVAVIMDGAALKLARDGKEQEAKGKAALGFTMDAIISIICLILILSLFCVDGTSGWFKTVVVISGVLGVVGLLLHTMVAVAKPTRPLEAAINSF